MSKERRIVLLNGHGRFYKAWANMKVRCKNKNKYKKPYYENVSYCNKWESFSGFFDDMYESFIVKFNKHGQDTTLDRIDPYGNYEKSNCKWATMKEQSYTKKNSLLITFKDKTLNLNDWAEFLNMKKSTLSMRYYVRKWSIEKCLTMEVM